MIDPEDRHAAGDDPASRWDRRYADGDWEDVSGPALLLEEALPWLDGRGRALDLACGAGRNAVRLAALGYAVLAVDLSLEGLRITRRRAAEGGLRVQPLLADVDRLELLPESFQVVVNTHFLLRSAFDLIRRTLAPGGILVFETFNVDEIDILGGDIRREYALERGELRRVFPEFEVLLYEEGVVQREEGERGLARMIARKPG